MALGSLPQASSWVTAHLKTYDLAHKLFPNGEHLNADQVSLLDELGDLGFRTVEEARSSIHQLEKHVKILRLCSQPRAVLTPLHQSRHRRSPINERPCF